MEGALVMEGEFRVVAEGDEYRAELKTKTGTLVEGWGKDESEALVAAVCGEEQD